MKPPYCAVCDAPVDPVDANLHGTSPTGTSPTGPADPAGIAPDARDWYCDRHRPGRVPSSPESGAGTLLERYARLRATQRRVAIAPVALDELATCWHALMPAVADTLGTAWSSPPSRQRRAWQPMDGVEPPHCPFTEEERWDDGPLALEVERAYWAQGDLARAQVVLTVRRPAGSTRVSGHIPADGSGVDVTELILTGERLPDSLERLILAINAQDRAQ